MESGDPGLIGQQKRALHEVDDRSDFNVVKNRRLNKNNQPYVNTRCSPKVFLDYINRLSKEKRDIICSLGLGGLLELKVTKNNNAMVLELLKRFDKDTCSLKVHGQRLILTEDSVRRIMGFGSGQSEMKRLRSNLSTLLLKVNIEKRSRKDLIEGLDQIEDATNWTANFILLAYNSILRPSSSLSCSPTQLNFFNDIGKLKEVNRSKLVIDGLCDAAKDVVANLNQVEEGKRKSIYVKGCSLLLELFYVEHVDCGVLKTPWKDRRTPRVLDWTDEMVRKVYAFVDKRFDDDSVKIIMPSYQEAVSKTTLDETRTGETAILEKVQVSEERLNVVETQVKAILEKVQHFLPTAPTMDDNNNEYRSENSRLDALEKKFAHLTEKLDLFIAKNLNIELLPPCVWSPASVSAAPFAPEHNVQQAMETQGDNSTSLPASSDDQFLVGSSSPESDSSDGSHWDEAENFNLEKYPSVEIDWSSI